MLTSALINAEPRIGLARLHTDTDFEYLLYKTGKPEFAAVGGQPSQHTYANVSHVGARHMKSRPMATASQLYAGDA
jgi:hypothetical protein